MGWVKPAVTCALILPWLGVVADIYFRQADPTVPVPTSTGPAPSPPGTVEKHGLRITVPLVVRAEQGQVEVDYVFEWADTKRGEPAFGFRWAWGGYRSSQFTM